MIEPTPRENAVLDQMLAGVRENLNTVIESAMRHLNGLCPAVGECSREVVVAHITAELTGVASFDSVCEMLALCAVELAEQRIEDSL